MVEQAGLYRKMATGALKYSPEKGKRDPKNTRSATPAQVIQMVMQEARNRGMNWFQPHHAAGMTGNFMQETGNFRNDVINFQVRGDDGTAHGLMQWRGVRFDNLMKFAKGRNLNPADIRTQVSFAFEEGQSNSPYTDFGSVRAFKDFPSAKNASEASTIFVAAERPAGWNGKYGSNDDNGKRLVHTAKALQEFDGTPPDQRGFQGTDNTFASMGYDPIQATREGRGTNNDTSFNLDNPNMFIPLGAAAGTNSYDASNPSKQMFGTNPDRFGIQAFIDNKANNPFLNAQPLSKRSRYSAFGADG